MTEPTRQTGRSAGVFIAAALIDSLGTGCFLAGSIIFFTKEIGLSGAQVGLGLSLAAAAGFLATLPVGRLADRLGAKPVLIALLLLRAVGFVSYGAASSFTTFILSALLVGSGEKPTSPVQQQLLADVVGRERRQHLLAVTRSVRNVGFGAGSVLAGLILVPGFPLGLRAIALVNAGSFVLSAVLMMRVRPRKSAPRVTAGRTWRLRDHSYTRLTALNGVMTLHMTLLVTGIPLWIVTSTDLPDQTIPALVLTNTVFAVVFQVPVAKRVVSGGAAKKMLRLAGVGLAACCLLLAPMERLAAGPALVCATLALLALTAAELTQAAGGWDLSFRLAEDFRRGQYLSFFSLGVTLQTIVGPWLITSVVLPLGAMGWCVTGGALFFLAQLTMRLPLHRGEVARGRRRLDKRASRRGTSSPFGRDADGAAVRAGQHQQPVVCSLPQVTATSAVAVVASPTMSTPDQSSA